MKVLCVGHTCWDISCQIDNFPPENGKYRFSDVICAGGGPASNAAFLLGKWGVNVTIQSVIGSDTFGDKIKTEFQRLNVRTDYMETAYDKDTSLSFILINKRNGSRTVYNIVPEFVPIKKYNYDFTPDIILTDGYDYGATQNAINTFPKAIKIIDAGSATPEVLELCKSMDYIVCSKVFAEKATNVKIDYNKPNTLVDLYSILSNKYPNIDIIVTLEEKGALYMDENEIKIMPGLNSIAKDTTGAGDIFHGAFTYAIANNYKLEDAVMLANIAGGLSVNKIGSRLSMPVLSDVLDYYQRSKLNLNSKMNQGNHSINKGNNPNNQGSNLANQGNNPANLGNSQANQGNNQNTFFKNSNQTMNNGINNNDSTK